MPRSIEFQPTELTLTRQAPEHETTSSYFYIFPANHPLLVPLNDGSHIIAEISTKPNDTSSNILAMHLTHPYHICNIPGEEEARLFFIKEPTFAKKDEMQRTLKGILELMDSESKYAITKWYIYNPNVQ